MASVKAGITIGKGASGDAVMAGRSLFCDDGDALMGEIGNLLDQPKSHLIMTLNVDQVLLMQNDDSLAEAYRSASICTLDGMPLVWFAKMLGVKDAQRNTGADLIYEVCRTSSSLDWRVGIAGGRPGVAERAANRLRKIYPDANVFGLDFPEIHRPDDSESVGFITELRSLDVDVLFLCLGCPKQEKWFQYWRPDLPNGVYIGAGAAVDFAAGIVQRAPVTVQRVGLEWLWRLCQDPRRLARRYLIRGPKFLEVVLRSLALRIRG